MQDADLVTRAVARASLYVRGTTLQARKLQRVLDSVPGGTGIRSDVIDRLTSRGIDVVVCNDAHRPASDDAIKIPAEPHLTSGVGEGTKRGIDKVRALQSARRVLDLDRRSSDPQKRLLSAVQEVGLAALVRDRAPLAQSLPSGYRKTLVSGTEKATAFDALVLHNVRLVWSIARTFLPRIAAGGSVMDIEDLVQAGMPGLIRAVEMFDATRGLKFSTYATHWIRQSIAREVDNTSRLIRLPVHVMEDVRRVTCAAEKLRLNGKPVHPAALAEETHLPLEKVINFLNYLRGSISLDRQVGDDGTSRLLDFVPANPQLAPEWQALVKLRNETLDDLLDNLSLRSASILRMRHGWGGEEPMTLDEIGQVFGITRERVRQLEGKALECLKHGDLAADVSKLRSWTA